MRVRLLLFIAVMLIAVVTLFLLLLATDTAMSVWQRLSEAPLWLQVAYALVLLLISGATFWLSWHWLRPASKVTESEEHVIDDSSLQESLLESASAGVDVSYQRNLRASDVTHRIFGDFEWAE